MTDIEEHGQSMIRHMIRKTLSKTHFGSCTEHNLEEYSSESKVPNTSQFIKSESKPLGGLDTMEILSMGVSRMLQILHACGLDETTSLQQVKRRLDKILRAQDQLKAKKRLFSAARTKYTAKPKTDDADLKVSAGTRESAAAASASASTTLKSDVDTLMTSFASVPRRRNAQQRRKTIDRILSDGEAVILSDSDIRFVKLFCREWASYVQYIRMYSDDLSAHQWDSAQMITLANVADRDKDRNFLWYNVPVDAIVKAKPTYVTLGISAETLHYPFHQQIIERFHQVQVIAKTVMVSRVPELIESTMETLVEESRGLMKPWLVRGLLSTLYESKRIAMKFETESPSENSCAGTIMSAIHPALANLKRQCRHWASVSLYGFARSTVTKTHRLFFDSIIRSNQTILDSFETRFKETKSAASVISASSGLAFDTMASVSDMSRESTRVIDEFTNFFLSYKQEDGNSKHSRKPKPQPKSKPQWHDEDENDNETDSETKSTSHKPKSIRDIEGDESDSGDRASVAFSIGGKMNKESEHLARVSDSAILGIHTRQLKTWLCTSQKEWSAAHKKSLDAFSTIGLKMASHNLCETKPIQSLIDMQTRLTMELLPVGSADSDLKIQMYRGEIQDLIRQHADVTQVVFDRLKFTALLYTYRVCHGGGTSRSLVEIKQFLQTVMDVLMNMIEQDIVEADAKAIDLIVRESTTGIGPEYHFFKGASDKYMQIEEICRRLDNRSDGDGKQESKTDTLERPSKRARREQTRHAETAMQLLAYDQQTNDSFFQVPMERLIRSVVMGAVLQAGSAKADFASPFPSASASGGSKRKRADHPHSPDTANLDIDTVLSFQIPMLLQDTVIRQFITTYSNHIDMLKSVIARLSDLGWAVPGHIEFASKMAFEMNSYHQTEPLVVKIAWICYVLVVMNWFEYVALFVN